MSSSDSEEVKLERGDILLVSGYRRHGKDTFFNHLTGSDSRFVYHPVTFDLVPFEFPKETYRRFAFADVLKQECSAILGMTLEEIEAKKDNPLPEGVAYAFKCINPSSPPTVRDVLIDHGAYCRSLNVNYWCERVAEQLKEATDCIAVVTDFRFENEHNYLKSIFSGTTRRVVPLRIFRRHVPIPDENDISEHSLDEFFFKIQIIC